MTGITVAPTRALNFTLWGVLTEDLHQRSDTSMLSSWLLVKNLLYHWKLWATYTKFYCIYDFFLLIPNFWVFEYPVPTWMSRRLCTKGGEKLKSIMAQANLNHIWYNSKWSWISSYIKNNISDNLLEQISFTDLEFRTF